jgi:hypothetical protein
MERRPIHFFQFVLNPNARIMANVSHQVTPIVLHTSGIRRFWQSFRGLDVSVVRTHRSAGEASP